MAMWAAVPVHAVRAQTAAPEIQGLINRIERLQRELQTLQRQVYRGNVPRAEAGAPAGAAAGAGGEPNLVAAMQVRLDEMELQVRTMTGKLEETNHAVGELSKKLTALHSDMDLRLKALEARGTAPAGPEAAAAEGAGPGPAAPPPGAAPSQPGTLGTLSTKDLQATEPQRPVLNQVSPSGATIATLPRGTPEQQYRQATALLAQADYPAAQRAFEAFLAAHASHELAGNAQYWLGETYYVRGDFNAAARAFAKGYKDYPNSGKGPDNLLKLGMSLAGLGKTRSACTTFGRLAKDFPQAPTPIKSRVAAERRKLRCR